MAAAAAHSGRGRSLGPGWGSGGASAVCAGGGSEAAEAGTSGAACAGGEEAGDAAVCIAACTSRASGRPAAGVRADPRPSCRPLCESISLEARASASLSALALMRASVCRLARAFASPKLVN